MWFVELMRAIAWPIVALVIFSSLWKKGTSEELIAFIRRRIALELPGGFKATIDAATEQKAIDNPAQEQLPVAPAMDPSPRPGVNSMEKRLREDVMTIEEPKRIPVLLRALAQSRLDAGHEFTYNRIFGSQILALKRLNEIRSTTVEEASAFFRPYAEQYPQFYSNYGFNGWLEFLVLSTLVDNNADRLTITDVGRDFLVYITDKRLTELKPW